MNEKLFASFQKAQGEMVATSDAFWKGSLGNQTTWSVKFKEYSLEEVAEIIKCGSREQQRLLSQNYFYRDGLYRRIITYYATLLKYVGLVIPNSDKLKNLSNSSTIKKYNKAIDYVEAMKLPTLLTDISEKVLVNGIYFGIILSNDKNSFAVMDLPFSFCRTRAKDWLGNDIIEFNVSYFDTISDKDMKEYALKIYPKAVVSYYKKWKKGIIPNSDPWVIISTKISLCFYLFDFKPFFQMTCPDCHVR